MIIITEIMMHSMAAMWTYATFFSYEKSGSNTNIPPPSNTSLIVKSNINCFLNTALTLLSGIISNVFLGVK